MNEYEIKNIVSNQRKYFLSGATLDINARVSALKKLKDSIIKHEPEINEALKTNLAMQGLKIAIINK